MRRALVTITAAALLVGAWWVPAASAAPTCFGRTATVQGSPRADGWTYYYGTDGPDVIIGTDIGSDKIYGAYGNDLICARGGVYDVIWDGPGDDRVQGGAGADDFETGPGRDVYWGGFGRDAVWGLGGGSTFYGGPGNDYVEFDDPLTADRAYGEGGNDTLHMNAGGPADVVNGGVGADTCAVNRADQVTGCETFVR